MKLDRLDLVEFKPEICMEYPNRFPGFHQIYTPRIIRILLYTRTSAMHVMDWINDVPSLLEIFIA
jgi:hypothetical protein